MIKIFFTIVFATIIISVSAQRSEDRAEVSFKTTKIVGDKMNVYFDIAGVTDTSQFSFIENAIESNSEVSKSNIYVSSYGSSRCMILTSLNVNAVEIRNILKDINLDYDSKSVRFNNTQEVINNTQK